VADRPPVIDADGHILERQEDIRKYLEPPWDLRPTPLTTDREAWDTSMFGKLPGYPGYVNGMSPTEQVELWLRIMDEAGMEEAVLFPTALSGMVRLPERDFCVAACRAANDHFAKEYNALSDRIHVVGLLPLNWPEDAAAELRRAVTELGLVSFELPAIGPSVALGDPMYDPLYEEAQRLDVPLSLHGGRSPSHVVGASGLRTFGEVHAYAFPAGVLLQFTSILMQGVPVRYPRLRWCFLEIGATWLPYWLDRLDEHWELRGDIEAPHLGKKPSQVVRESPIYVSLEAEETLLPQAVDYLGNDHFMYASDIPHWDGGFPKNLEGLWEHPGLSQETKEKIAYHNAKAFFGLGAQATAPAR
jgi:predicted TIM-barrel fold metal-dependent hydrolase